MLQEFLQTPIMTNILDLELELHCFGEVRVHTCKRTQSNDMNDALSLTN